jgi:DNA-binding ferritin-like protein
MPYHATLELLLLKDRTSADLETVKVAAALGRVPDDEKKWPAHVFSELCKELPYLAQYDIEIVIDRMDPEAGAALGYAQIQNKTQSRPQEAAAAAGNVIRVPIIIKERRLQKFYIFEAGGQTYPMGEARIQQAMLNPLIFDTDATRAPSSPSLLDQIYPPGQQRTGFGRVTDAGAMGLTKLNDAPIEAYHQYHRVLNEARDVRAAALRGGAEPAAAHKALLGHLAAHGYHTNDKGKVRVPTTPPSATPGATPTVGSAARTELRPPQPQAASATAGAATHSTWVAPHPAGQTGASTRSTWAGPHPAADATGTLTRATEVVPRPPVTAAAAAHAAPAAQAAVHGAQAAAAHQAPAAGRAAVNGAGGIMRHLTGRNALIAAGATGVVAGGGLLAHHLLKRPAPAPAQKSADAPIPLSAAAAGLLGGYYPGKALAGHTAAGIAPHGYKTRADDIARKAAIVAGPAAGILALVAARKYGLTRRLQGMHMDHFPAGLVGNSAEERALLGFAAPTLAGGLGTVAGGVATGAGIGGVARVKDMLTRRAAEKQAEHTPAPDPGVVASSLQPVLAALLALHQFYFFAHWTSQGEGFYGDHQLFTRLYEGAQEDFDSVAERLVGHGGNQALDPAAIFTQASAMSAQWIGEGASIPSAALVAEQAVQEALTNAYGTMDQSGGLSLGIDDLLMSLASRHEGNQYLLKQRDPSGGAVAAPPQQLEVPDAPAPPTQEPAAVAAPQEAPPAAPAPAQPGAPIKTASLRSFFARISE